MISATLLALCVNGVTLHEGFRHNVYKDRNGWSIGHGYSLTQNPLHLDKKIISKFKREGISEVRSKKLVATLCGNAQLALESKFEWYNRIPTQHKYVMLDMTYNLGIGGLEKFDKTLFYIRRHKSVLASKEMLDSKWSHQVRGRSIQLAEIVKKA
jgi:GH24 family phage-related lysozyme (muramidase)